MKYKHFVFNRLIAFIVIGICVASIFSSCGNKAAEVKQEIKNVKVIEARLSNVSTEVEYASRLKPIQEISISPKIAGKVATVKADVGNVVEKGQVLFTLDPSDLQAQLSQQEANLDTSRTNSDQTLQNAQITYDNARESYDKNKQLYDAGAISKQILDDSKQRLDNATVALNFAKNNYNLVYGKGTGISPAAAGVQVASTQLQNTVITSPISGIISVCNIDIGEIASSAAPAYVVIDNTVMIAEINLPDKMIGKISKGQKVSLKINALNDKSIEGVIESISPAADSRMQTYTVKVKIENPNNELKSGMFARVIVPEDKKENVLVVPNEAIKVENGVPFVYTVVNEVAIKKIAVTTGLSNDQITEVTSNLKQGDSIITEGQIFLNDGEKVNVVK